MALLDSVDQCKKHHLLAKAVPYYCLDILINPFYNYKYLQSTHGSNYNLLQDDCSGLSS